MFHWTAAADKLCRISTFQIHKFLKGPDVHDLYGIGYFCNACDGSVHLVANTEIYHQNSLRDFQTRFGPTDSEVFRWDIGNWKYPGGLFPSSSPEQVEFDSGWEAVRESLTQMKDDKKQDKLEDFCESVLSIIFKERAVSTIPTLKGFIVLGPDDRQQDVVDKVRLLDRHMLEGEERRTEQVK